MRRFALILFTCGLVYGALVSGEEGPDTDRAGVAVLLLERNPQQPGLHIRSGAPPHSHRTALVDFSAASGGWPVLPPCRSTCQRRASPGPFRT